MKRTLKGSGKSGVGKNNTCQLGLVYKATILKF